jgi:dihydrofolate reductase
MPTLNKMPKISLIAAMSQNWVIGFQNQLPWKPIAEDWANLKVVTAGKKMIMGRKSYESPHRVFSETGNIVITSNPNYEVESGFEIASNLTEALQKYVSEEEVFILGGEQVFKEAITLADKIHLTIVHRDLVGDTFFPKFPEDDFEIIQQTDFQKDIENNLPFSIIVYQRKAL